MKKQFKKELERILKKRRITPYLEKRSHLKNKNVWRLRAIVFFMVFLFVLSLSLSVKYIAESQDSENRAIVLKQEILKLQSEINIKTEMEMEVSKKLRYMEFQSWVVNKILPTIRKESIRDAMRIIPIVYKSAREYKFSPKLIMRIIRQESHFSQYAQSKVAFGYMQINYKAWKDKADITEFSELFDPEYNIKLGCKILRHYVDLADGDIEIGLHWYNNGFLYNNRKYVPNVLGKKF